LEYFFEKGRIIRYFIMSVFVLFIILNLFQFLQFNMGIIDAYRMTGKYYLAVFGKTHINKNDKKLLLVERSFEEKQKIPHDVTFKKSIIYSNYFEVPAGELNNHIVKDTVYKGKYSLKMDSTMMYSPGIEISYEDITACEYAWIRAIVYVYIPINYEDESPYFVMTFNHNNINYCWKGESLDKTAFKKGEWVKLSMDYMTPEVRSIEDKLKIYVWHRGKKAIYIDDISIEKYEPQ